MPSPPLVPRRVAAQVTDALADTRVVLISGARRAGKSTLVRIVAGGRLPGWSRNLGTRTTAAAKLVFVDSGIAANDLATDGRALLRPGAPFGPLLESFVLSELSRQLTWSQQSVDLSHYRDQSRYEVDAVLDNRAGYVVGIEVKAATTVGLDDFRGLRRLADRLGDDFIAGIVLYAGASTLPFGDKLRAMPVSALWQVPAPPSP